jgi:hypothetical protein
MRRTTTGRVAAMVLTVWTTGPVNAGGASEATETVWQRHLQSALAGDIDAMLADFSEESVIITREGPIRGEHAIRGFFEAFLAGSTPEANATVVVNSEIVEDRMVFFNFTVGAEKRTFSDTALIEDGKIKVLTTVDYAAE